MATIKTMKSTDSHDIVVFVLKLCCESLTGRAVVDDLLNADLRSMARLYEFSDDLQEIMFIRETDVCVPFDSGQSSSFNVIMKRIMARLNLTTLPFTCENDY